MAARKNLTALILGIMLSAGMASCENWMIEQLLERNEPSGGGNGGGSTVERVEITNGTERRGGVGGALIIRTEVYPANATNKEVKWTSSNPEIADVVGTANGATVQLFEIGSTEIRVKPANGGKDAVCTITVVPAGSGVVVTGISLDRYSLNMEEGGSTETLVATVLATSVTDEPISWASSNTGVATVSNGEVRPVGFGSTAITASVSGITPAICVVTVSESTSPDLSVKFKATGATDVKLIENTFQKIHEYLSGLSRPSYIEIDKKIKLGDYIDLAGLKVDEYNGSGAIDESENTPIDGGANGYLLRIMVVGINSFNAQGLYTGGGTPARPHIVMQFQNVPVRRMIDPSSQAYGTSEMRAYITVNFKNGLEAAGVPMDTDIIWGPNRIITNTPQSGIQTITDKLWLPTEREMFNVSSSSNSSRENPTNQAYLEYYVDNAKRLKYVKTGGSPAWYWESSPANGSSTMCCAVNSGGIAVSSGGSGGTGVAPAFCVQ
ncbi:MAG: Ig-like domain-containing protein [Spirochaetaceae bacterium]|jgi:hypothetical protein|nr:Ig-like domain-containing protein [Spirochaetaceae bacterium]